MNQIHVDPYKEYQRINIGFQYDHNENELVFDKLTGTNNYLKLSSYDGDYSSIPIPDNKFPITSTYTDKPRVYQAQIMKMVNNELIANSPIFELDVRQSIPYNSQIKETVPPNFQTAYNNMVDTTEKIETKLADGSFKGDKGDKGDDGLTAYEVAVKNGFKGTETEWLDSLQEGMIKMDIWEQASHKSLAEGNPIEIKDSIDYNIIDMVISVVAATPVVKLKSINITDVLTQTVKQFSFEGGFISLNKGDTIVKKNNLWQILKSTGESVLLSDANQKMLNTLPTYYKGTIIDFVTTDGRVNARVLYMAEPLSNEQIVDTTTFEKIITQTQENIHKVETSTSLNRNEINNVKSLINAQKTETNQQITSLREESAKQSERLIVALPKPSQEGEGILTLTDSTDYRVLNQGETEPLFLGTTTQDGVPSPESPVPILNGKLSKIGDNGKNLIDFDHLKNYDNWKLLERTVKVYPLDLKPNVNYIFSGTATTNTKYIFLEKSIDGGKTWVEDYKLIFQELEVINRNNIVTSVKEGEMYRLWSNNPRSVDALLSFQLEVGTVKTSIEPYKGQTLTLSQPIELSKWDSIFRDSDGKWKKKIQSKKNIYDGSKDERWRVYDDGRIISVSDVGIHTPVKEVGPIFSNLLPPSTGDKLWRGEKGITLASTGEVILRMDKILTVDEWENYLSSNNLVVIFKTKESIITELPQTVQDLLNQLVTFYPQTTLTTDEGVILNVKYLADIEHFVERKFNELSQQVAETNKAVVSLGGV